MLFITIPLVLILSLFHSTYALAQTSDPIILSERQIEVFAKEAIVDELNFLNPHLAAKETDIKGYRTHNLKRFYKTRDQDGIEDEVPFETCIFNGKNLKAIRSKTVSMANVQVTAKTQALYSVKDSLGAPVWRLLSRACIHAKSRFEDRLHHLTIHQGTPVQFNQTMIENLADFVFMPTDKGKPGWKHSRQTVYNFLIGAALITNNLATWFKIPLIGTVIPVIAMVNTSMGLKKQVQFSKNTFSGYELNAIGEKYILFFDFNEEEKILWEVEKLK